MKISEKFGKGKCVFSLEIFPPKKDMSPDTVYDTIDSLVKINPAFISVTYGAGGTVGNNITAAVAQRINSLGIDSAAHLTCVSNTKSDIDIILEDFKSKGIENILALRGDISPERPPRHDFEHACDLVRYIREKGDFHISGACYPECHTQAGSFEEDIARLKEKVDSGVTHLMSQLFFDNSAFYRFLDMARGAGINVPVEAGIMPVTNKKSIERMVMITGASLPAKFTRIMARYENNPIALRDAGIAYAIDQIVDLISSGVDGIHLYAMNNPYVAGAIYEGIRSLL